MTAQPNLKPHYKAIPLDTTNKTTQRFEDKYFAKVEFTLDYGYGQIKTYTVGDEIMGIATKDGLAQYCNHGAVVEHFIPWENITTKTFCTVREYITTVFEVVVG
jgi:hypothetical protein